MCRCVSPFVSSHPLSILVFLCTPPSPASDSRARCLQDDCGLDFAAAARFLCPFRERHERPAQERAAESNGGVLPGSLRHLHGVEVDDGHERHHLAGQRRLEPLRAPVPPRRLQEQPVHVDACHARPHSVRSPSRRRRAAACIGNRSLKPEAPAESALLRRFCGGPPRPAPSSGASPTSSAPSMALTMKPKPSESMGSWYLTRGDARVVMRATAAVRAHAGARGSSSRANARVG